MRPKERSWDIRNQGEPAVLLLSCRLWVPCLVPLPGSELKLWTWRSNGFLGLCQLSVCTQKGSEKGEE